MLTKEEYKKVLTKSEKISLELILFLEDLNTQNIDKSDSYVICLNRIISVFCASVIGDIDEKKSLWDALKEYTDNTLIQQITMLEAIVGRKAGEKDSGV